MRSNPAMNQTQKSVTHHTIWLPLRFRKFLEDRSIPCGQVRHIVGTVGLIECTEAELSMIYQGARDYTTGIPTILMSHPGMDHALKIEAIRTRNIIMKYLWGLKHNVSASSHSGT